MDGYKGERPVAIERGTVVEKEIATGTFWWRYKVESSTRDGLKSLWMESIDVWEHVRLEELGGNQEGYPVGTEVYFFLFGDGYGLILNRLNDDAESYKARIGVFAETMAVVIEKEDLILEKLADMKTQITNAKTDINGHTDTKKSELSSEITSAKNTLDTAITNAKTAINNNTDTRKGELSTQLTNAQKEIDDRLDAAQAELDSRMDTRKGELSTQLTNAQTEIDTRLDTRKGELDTAITNAKNALDTAITNAKTALDTAITNAKTSIEGKIADAKTDITTAISNAKTSIEGKLTDIKNLEDDIWDKLNE